MLTVTICKGLPASGKSVWACQKISENPNSIKRINKDLLREMLDDSIFTGKSEKFICKVRDQLIIMALEEGKHVIVDDTNLNPVHTARIEQLVREFNSSNKEQAVVKIKEFDIDVDEAIKRDLKRAKSVGARVIRGMYNMYIRGPIVIKEPDDNLPNCIIVDIDGTVAEMVDRSPFDWDKVGEDKPVQTILNLVDAYVSLYNPTVVFMSGRDGVCYDTTKSWLVDNWGQHFELYMRAKDDMRKDSIVKEELYRKHIAGRFNVQFVLDDRQQVVDMWRRVGLRCLQVAEGDF